MYDILIVGAGPAGLSAAIYGRRAGKSVLILEKGTFGGQMTFSPKIENYPGFPVLSGMELADKMVEQATLLGAEIEIDTVLRLEDHGSFKRLLTEYGSYDGKTVIIATGAKHRLLGVPGEEELIGNGISFCAVCDGAFFKDKEVAVIGGGNSALQEAVLLSETCRKVTVLQNLPYLTGEQSLQTVLQGKENVELVCNVTVNGFSKQDDRIISDLTVSGIPQKAVTDGVFIAVGLVPDNTPFEQLVTLENGYIASDERCLTNIPGVFTAGDCRTKGTRQIATAVADGAVAALAACKIV